MKPGLIPPLDPSLSDSPPAAAGGSAPSRTAARPQDSTRERLIDQAHTLLAQGGLKALSVRNLAAAAGLSTSAVPYHLGDKDSLTQAVFLAGAERDRQAWAQFRVSLGDGGLPVHALADALVVQALDLSSRQGTIELVWYELIHQARHTPALRPILTQWYEERRGRYRDLFALAGLPTHIADIMTHYLVGDRSTLLVAGGASGFALSVVENIRHLCDPEEGRSALWHERLRRPGGASDDGGEPVGETERRIVAAAVATIIDQGVAAVTHRAVAQRAGVSLSSTTYYFRSRGDIIRRAFQFIHEELRREIPTVHREPPPLDIFLRAVADNMLTPVEGGRIAGRNTTHAMGDFALEACRDASLVPLYLAFRQGRGSRIRAALDYVVGPQSSLSPFQAQIVSTWMQGRAQILHAMDDPPDAAGPDIDGYAAEMIVLMRYLQPAMPKT
ncbi:MULTISPECIES: TetR/AcrR family transcriptional regulator [Nitrospirillum]|uniref:TetR family transcriptional regulator n=1 Tax=Nitrospirillum amazonense TaxID=28077 RepID=A0A560FKW2_9PROT|nr:TetR family transcriptional regulator [Nitrospirillum amazonense]MEC4590856.1 TetR family transcriptional regulator [Nitrospirillum amazonense]TWB22239.1 TetR family transcriptional regulator [Nitrospirillum amazonense]